MKIKNLKKQINYLIQLTNKWEEQDSIPQIEKDIAMTKVQELYETLLDFNAKCEPVIEATQQETIIEEEKIIQEDAAQEIEEETLEEEVQEEEIAIQQDQEPLAARDAVEQAKALFAQLQSEPVVEQTQEDVIEQEVETIEESAVEQEAIEEEESTEENPPKDHSIQANINSEQKIKFIHDLFCNDSTFYDQELGKMNHLESFDDVLMFIGQNYNWSSNSQSAQEFVEIVAMKFNENI